MKYRAIAPSGKWLTDFPTENGFNSYYHHEAKTFDTYEEAAEVASRYKGAWVEYI